MCLEFLPDSDCNVMGVVYHHNDTWADECNTCTCVNGHTECTKVWCGPTNCYDDNLCECSSLAHIGCLTPPCDKWGQCIGSNMEVLNGKCTPDTQQSELNEDCVKVIVVFNLESLQTVSYSSLLYFPLHPTTGKGFICHALNHSIEISVLLFCLWGIFVVCL